MKLDESSFANALYVNMNKSNIGWSVKFCEIYAKGVANGILAALSAIKQDVPQAIIVKNEDDNIVFAAYTEKNAAEEGYGYSVVFTCDKNEIPENAEQHFIDDPVVYGIITDTMSHYNGIIVQTMGQKWMNKLFAIFIATLRSYMNNNYELDRVLEFPTLFKVEASRDDGNYFHLSFTLDPVLKQRIKDDESAQNVA